MHAAVNKEATFVAKQKVESDLLMQRRVASSDTTMPVDAFVKNMRADQPSWFSPRYKLDIPTA